MIPRRQLRQRRARWPGKSSYAYDKLNRLVTLTPPNARPMAFAYDAASQRTSLIFGNLTKALYTYDGEDVVLEMGATKNVVALYDQGPGTDEVLSMRKGTKINRK